MNIDSAVQNSSRTLVIVAVNLTFGVVALVVIGFFVGPLMDPDGAVVNILRWIAVALPALEIAPALMIYTAQGKRLATFKKWETRLELYRARAIFTIGLLEAPALFAGVVTLLCGFTWHVIPGVALYLLVITALFPSPGRIKRTIGTSDGNLPA